MYVHIARFCWKIGGGIGGKGLKLDIAATGLDIIFSVHLHPESVSLPSLIRFHYH